MKHVYDLRLSLLLVARTQVEGSSNHPLTAGTANRSSGDDDQSPVAVPAGEIIPK